MSTITCFFDTIRLCIDMLKIFDTVTRIKAFYEYFDVITACFVWGSRGKYRISIEKYLISTDERHLELWDRFTFDKTFAVSGNSGISLLFYFPI